MVIESCIMGDKFRSEIQKPVKNPLLSGAGHGFPFESFQGNSLLVPVSQDSPSVLNDDVGEEDKFVGQDSSNISSSFDSLPQSVESISLEHRSTPEFSNQPPQPPQTQQSSNQGYTGLFSSFFGGGQKQSEDSFSQPKPEQPVNTGSSNSPYAPRIQSYSPSLQAPGVTSTPHPAQIADISAASPLPPPNKGVAGTSKYRLSHNKKFAYAPVPGLTSTSYGPSVFQPSDNSPHQQVTSLPPSIFNPGLNQSENQPQHQIQPEPQIQIQPHLQQQQSQLQPHLQSQPPLPPQPQLQPQSPPLLPPQSQLQPQSQPLLPPQPQLQQQSQPPLPPQPQPPPPPLSQSQFQPQPQFQTQPQSSYSFPPPTNFNNQTQPPPPVTLFNPNNFPSIEKQDQPFPPPPPPLFSVSANENRPPSSQQSYQAVNFFNQTSPSVPEPTPFINTVPSSYSFPPPKIESSPSASTVSFNRPPSNNSFITENLPSSQSQPALFSPISNESFNPSPPVSVLNPVPLHPSHSVPVMSALEQSPGSSSAIQQERPPSIPIVPPSLNNLANLGQSGIIYRPVYHHWFLKREDDTKEVWQPFTMSDSLALEQAYNSADLNPDTLVATDGGRYDVKIIERKRYPVYWEEEPKEVRRCSWFYKSTTESRFRPYDENTAYILELEYKTAVTTNSWKKEIRLTAGEYIVLYGPNSMAHFPAPSPSPDDGWEATPDLSQTSQTRPRIVKRGVLDDFEIDDGEAQKVDHLLFIVHGIGSVCDLKFRKIEEAVDSFRSHAHQLVKSHFKSSVEQGYINRIEILPVSWHSHLHGDATGVDKKLQTLTLKSIPKLRHFTNDTLLDILFYTSPVYCQNMMQQVGQEINKLFDKFKSRNPGFYGGVSLAGHSLGSLILFDLLCHQKSSNDEDSLEMKERSVTPVEDRLSANPEEKRRLSRNVSYVMGTAGTGQPFITYPQINFHPTAFFAMGSPIGMFVTVRGIDSLGLDFKLPTCPGFFNIFHPFDPVAYRIEALINPELADKRPVLIPHHKGRKRMHLELKETMARVGADLKQRIIDSMRSTWNTVYQLTTFGRADDNLEQEVGQVIEKQFERQRMESVSSGLNEYEDLDFNAGCLNQGRRVDHVLQEAPLESLNEYVSAITSHVMYWDSEDTVLLILKEIYSTMGVSPDKQQYGSFGMPDDLSPPSPSFQAQGWNYSNNNLNETRGGGSSSGVPPPPTSGFFRN